MAAFSQAIDRWTAAAISDTVGGMRIRDITTHILRAELGEQKFYSSQCAFPERNSLLVRVETDDGVVGWGEGGQYGPPEPVATCVEKVLAPLIVGEDLQGPMVVWDSLYGYSRDFGQKGTYIEAMSAIDIALWDLEGKRLGVPVHALLGGRFRQSVATYATGGYYRESEYRTGKADLPSLETELQGFVAKGFDTIKMKIGLLSIEEDLRRVEAARSAAGAKTTLLADCNHAYNSSTAVRIGRELERLGIAWLEEPVPPEDRNGYRRVRDKLGLAVAGGEAEFTRYGFRDLIASECVDIVQPDLCACGGFSEFVNIRGLVSTFGLRCIPHVWGSGVAFCAALHAIATIPPAPNSAVAIPLQNHPMIEFDQTPNPLRTHLLRNPFVVNEGNRIDVPAGSGLGIDIDEDFLREHEHPV